MFWDICTVYTNKMLYSLSYTNKVGDSFTVVYNIQDTKFKFISIVTILVGVGAFGCVRPVKSLPLQVNFFR
jgi:hypothetical protein